MLNLCRTSEFWLPHHSYDDTQIYIVIRKENRFSDKAFVDLEETWDINLLERPYRLAILQLKLIQKLKILDLYLSSNLPLSMQFYVNTIAEFFPSCTSKVADIRRFSDKEECKKIVHAPIISKL